MPQPFTPPLLPLKNLDWSKFVHLIGKANRAISRFDGLLQSVPNPSVLLSPLTTQEAVLSSKIEGTQATLSDVLEYEANPSTEKPRYHDILEVLNYRSALQYAVKEIEKLPLSLRLIREMHRILMKEVRGGKKNSGEFRKTQNWIGPPGSSIESAMYVPPSPETLMTHLDNLEKYFHYDEKDPIPQLAIIHAQFELIHPFLDGNGRIGRILIPLFLYHKKILHQPMFYISAYFETHRDTYYENLRSISQRGLWEDWIQYFLEATVAQANVNIEKAKAILALYDEKKERIVDLTHSRYAIKALDALFRQPVFRTKDFESHSKIPSDSARQILQKLTSGSVLKTYGQRGREGYTYVFEELITIVK